jgi:hypothetical protein
MRGRGRLDSRAFTGRIRFHPGSPFEDEGVATLYSIPLSGNARYQALKAKLEARMAATTLE